MKTAMERIKEQEEAQEGDDHPFASVTLEGFGCHQCGYNGKFLLRAFKVMREVAIEESWGYGEQAATRREAGLIIDEEFEERMKE